MRQSKVLAAYLLERLLWFMDKVMTLLCIGLAVLSATGWIYDISLHFERYQWAVLTIGTIIVCAVLFILSWAEYILVTFSEQEGHPHILLPKKAAVRYKWTRYERQGLFILAAVCMFVYMDKIGWDGHNFAGDPWISDIGIKILAVAAFLFFEKTAHEATLDKLQGNTSDD